MGTNGTALSPYARNPNGTFVYENIQVTIDEELLEEIAETTGGQYFRATNNKKLQEPTLIDWVGIFMVTLGVYLASGAGFARAN